MVEIPITDWKILTEIIEKSSEKYPDPTTNLTQWRGQSNVDWKLRSSLSRLLANADLTEEQAIAYEKQSKTDFISQAHLLNTNFTYSSSDDPHSMLIDMQHYSCPTRLLDWTFSPYIALYFAVNDNFNHDSALFMWQWYAYHLNNKKVYPDEKDIKGGKIIDFQKHAIISIVHAERKNERIVRQQGTFSLANTILDDHDDLIIEMGKKANQDDGLLKIVIPHFLKLEFLSRLRIMNITSESLFPGLDGLGKSIMEQLLMRKWQRI